MLNKKTTIGALAAITALTVGVAKADLNDIKGDVYAGYASKYNFRGVDLGDDLAEAGLNLSTTCPLTQGTVSLGLWYGSMNDSERLTDNQLNTSLGWSKDIGNLDLGLGFINYNHIGPIGDTQEFYITLGTELFAGIRGSVAAYYDIDDNSGWYFEPTLSKSMKINDCCSLDLSAGAGFYESYAGALEDGFNHWFAGAALPWQAKQNVTVTPYVKYIDTDGGQFSGLNDIMGGNEWVGGVRVSVNF